MHKPIIDVDFSAMEKRIADHMEQRMASSIPVDLHILTAALMFGVMYSNVTRDQRAAAKRRNFAEIYNSEAEVGRLIPDGEKLARVFTQDELAEHYKGCGVSTPDDLSVALRSMYDRRSCGTTPARITTRQSQPPLVATEQLAEARAILAAGIPTE